MLLTRLETIYGEEVFASLCAANGTGTMDTTEALTFAMDGVPLTVDLAITCKVTTKTKTPVIDGEEFTLTTTTAKAKKI